MKQDDYHHAGGREQVMDLVIQIDEMEKRFARREQDLLKELNELRRRFLPSRGWG